jgi:predicted P-loop ATPase
MEKKSNLEVVHSGEPIKKTGNIVTDIKMFLNRYKFRRNIISRNIECNGVSLDDKQLNSIFINCKFHVNKATKDLVTAIIFSDYVSDYNPLTEIFEYYNKNKPKITTGYIEDIIGSIKTDTPNSETFIKKWLISIIASIHGKHSPLMLVLCGGQNTGKTEWFRRILPDRLLKYYAESKLDLGKDDEILMTKKLIIMDDEMGGKSKTEEKKLKEMTSKQIFSIREPYGRVSCDLLRLAILCGTTNDEEVLSDPTGNRRILPVRVLGIIHKLYNSVNKDLLFYEMYLEYMAGYSYELNTADIEMLKESNNDFKRSSPEEELVMRYFAHPEQCDEQTPISELTSSEIMTTIQSRSNIRMNQTKLGLVLKNLGFKQKHIKWMKSTKRVYLVVNL